MELSDTARKSCHTALQCCRAVGKLGKSAGKFIGAIRALVDAVGQLMGTLSQGPDTGIELPGSVCSCSQLVFQLVESQIDTVENLRAQRLAQGSRGGFRHRMGQFVHHRCSRIRAGQ